MRREPGRYRVEAVTARRNATALAQLARDLGARFAAVGDAGAYAELKAALSGSGIEAGAGETAGDGDTAGYGLGVRHHW